jgi:hypothetical protein
MVRPVFVRNDAVTKLMVYRVVLGVMLPMMISHILLVRVNHLAQAQGLTVLRRSKASLVTKHTDVWTVLE